MMHAYIGASESGKTYTMQSHARRICKAGWSVVVLDLVDEWPKREVWGKVKHTITADARAAARCVRAGRPLTVLRPGLRAAHGALAEELAAAAIAGPATIVCLPEAHNACPEHQPLSAALGDIVHRYRHPRVNARLWFDTQQLADLKKEVLSSATRLHFFAGACMRDGGRVRQLGGKALEAEVAAAGSRAAAGSKGWHVALNPINPSGPFKLERV